MTTNRDAIVNASRLLFEASRSIRVLKAVAWPSAVKEEFLARGATRLPEVEYPEFDLKPVLEKIFAARRLFAPIDRVGLWLERNADAIESSARMVDAVGTAGFFEHGRRVYGEPTAPLRVYPATPLELAQTVRDAIDCIARVDLDIAPLHERSAAEVAGDIAAALRAHFGDAAPEVTIEEHLSANALASATAIRIRKDARFTDRDAIQLLHHEAFVHSATALNGRAQTDLLILASGHAGTTRTQEGLAVFAEIISGSIELDRMRRLADRVFAIQMAIEGADFMEVFRSFRDRGYSEDQAFESARRVFRGGVLTGGAPFTKDVVYLFGLLSVTSAIRGMFAAGRSDCLRLLFCGRLDVVDIPALCELHAMGLVRAPRFLPPWIQDPRFLLALLTYSSFISTVPIEPLAELVSQLLADAPLVKI